MWKKIVDLVLRIVSIFIRKKEVEVKKEEQKVETKKTVDDLKKELEDIDSQIRLELAKNKDVSFLWSKKIEIREKILDLEAAR